MTRFNISLQEGIQLVLFALDVMLGGEIFVPKIPSYRIVDVAEAISPGCRKEVIGIRPGEKLHEEMITETDGLNSYEFDDHFVIAPTIKFSGMADLEMKSGKKCPDGFKYNSGSNDDWLSVEELRELIKAHVDPEFSV